MAKRRAEASEEQDDGEPIALGEVVRGRTAGGETAIPGSGEPILAVPELPIRSGAGGVVFAVTLGAFWLGAAAAFLWGYFGVEGLRDLGTHLIAFAAVVSFLPPFLFVAVAITFSRALAVGEYARRLSASAERLSHADEDAAGNAQRLGRVVRRELDALSAGLDGAFGRLRALETALQDRVAQLEDTSARAGVRTEAIAQRLQEERTNIEGATDLIERAASRASETLAGRAAQLKTLMESAGGDLKSAGQVLDAQSAQFRDAAEKAAGAPAAAALELDRQAKQIEAAADNAVSRAEFVLARQERQRSAMNDLLTRLKEEAAAFEKMLEGQQRALERAANQLAGEAQRLDELTGQGLQRMDAAMDNAAARTAQLTAGFNKEADNVKDAAETAAASMSRLVESLREAEASAQALMSDSAADAKRRTKDFAGEATASCEKLLRAASGVAEEAEKARAALAKAAEETERHIVALPGVAAQEAARVRDALRGETEKMLDMSARTLATLRNRSQPDRQGDAARPDAKEDGSGEGLRSLAKRITGQKRNPGDKKSGKGGFELSAVLAAAESPAGAEPGLRSGAAAALGALQAALADLAGDLDAAMEDSASPDLWRRYLDGDRGVFARKLANSIGPETVDRITKLYRDSPRFHDAAEAYLLEFESLLARAREGDRDGFLASTLLGADTGKIYLAVAYALGRLD